MKKIATIITIALGLLLWVLNFHVYNVNQQGKTHELFSFNQTKTELEDEENKTLDLSKIDLPSIFDAIIRSL